MPPAPIADALAERIVPAHRAHERFVDDVRGTHVGQQPAREIPSFDELDAHDRYEVVAHREKAEPEIGHYTLVVLGFTGHVRHVATHDRAAGRDAEDARTFLELICDQGFALDETAVAQREQHPVLLVEAEPLARDETHLLAHQQRARDHADRDRELGEDERFAQAQSRRVDSGRRAP